MTEPGIGPEDTEYRAICAYDPPGGTRCTNLAEIHILTQQRDPDGITVCLATCSQHHRIAVLAGEALDEHEHRGLCGLPGTAWDHRQKQCVIDDSGQEPELRALATLGAPETIGADR